MFVDEDSFENKELLARLIPLDPNAEQAPADAGQDAGTAAQAKAPATHEAAKDDESSPKQADASKVGTDAASAKSSP